MDITGDAGVLAGVFNVPVSDVLRTERGVFQVSYDMDVLGLDRACVGQLREVRDGPAHGQGLFRI